MADAVISYTDEDTGIVFRWHGGAYIDVGYITRVRSNGDVDMVPEFRAEDVINVWDYDGKDERSSLERQLWPVDVESGEWAYLGDLENASRPFIAVLERFEATCKRYLVEAMRDDEEGAES